MLHHNTFWEQATYDTLVSSLLRFVPFADQQPLQKLLRDALTTDEEDQFGDCMMMLGSSTISISEKEASKKLFIRLAKLNLVERPLSPLLAPAEGCKID